MSDRTTTWDEFFTQGLERSRTMVILRGFDPARTIELCEQAAKAGVTMIEVPIQDDGARPALGAAVHWGRSHGIPIGAGTVTDIERLEFAVGIGATSTVAPGFDDAVMEASLRLDVPHLPGVATASEVQRAQTAGCRWLRVFPAGPLGPEWVRALLGPFPSARFVVTGGIDVGNAHGFLDAGAAAASLGSAFASAAPEEVAALRR